MSLRHLIAWFLLIGVVVGGFLLAGCVHANYNSVARAIGRAYAVRPVFVSSQYITERNGINVEISFRIDTGGTQVPVFFDALAYTLVVVDPNGDTITEGDNAVRGVYIGRYSYWGSEQLLTSSNHVFRSPSVMRSLYKGRLLTEFHSGQRTLAALGEVTLEVETKLGRQTLAIPFKWQFPLTIPETDR